MKPLLIILIVLVILLFGAQPEFIRSIVNSGVGSDFWNVKITDVLLALFTFALVAIGAYQGVQLQRTVSTMQNTSEYQLRAYVSLDTGSVELVEDKEIKLKITLKNFGVTPAHGVKAVIQIYPQEPSQYIYFPEASLEGKQSSHIGSGSAIELHNHLVLTEQQIEMLRDKSIWIYLIGKVLYKDCFGKQQFTDLGYYVDNIFQDKKASIKPLSYRNDAS